MQIEHDDSDTPLHTRHPLTAHVLVQRERSRRGAAALARGERGTEPRRTKAPTPRSHVARDSSGVRASQRGSDGAARRPSGTGRISLRIEDMERGKSREGARDTAAKRRFELYCSSAEQLFDGDRPPHSRYINPMWEAPLINHLKEAARALGLSFVHFGPWLRCLQAEQSTHVGKRDARGVFTPPLLELHPPLLRCVLTTQCRTSRR